jgi:hypothetical protein
MSRNTLLRFSGIAAIAGGVLRVVDAFLTSGVAVHAQQIAYAVTDLMLVFGLCGIYLSRSNRLGWTGLVGFVTSITGILMVRSSELSLFGFSGYLIGATITLLGVVVLGISMMIHTAFPRLAPILWIVSLIAGLIGLATAAKDLGVLVAGVAFGAGFVAAGMRLLSEKSSGGE